MSTLDNMRREAKRWLRALRQQDSSAHERMRRAWPGAPRDPVLRDVQHALAREHGYEGWQRLRVAVQQPPSNTFATYEQLARDVLLAHRDSDVAALRRVNGHFHTHIGIEELHDGVAQRLSTVSAERLPPGSFSLDHAQLLVALRLGLDSWAQLVELFSDRGAPPQLTAVAAPYMARITPGNPK